MKDHTKRKKYYYNRTRKVSYDPFTRFETEYSKNIPYKELQKTNEKYNQEYIKKLNNSINSIPSKINPKNNFYGYINYNWLKIYSNIQNKDLQYITQIDNVRVIQEKVYENIFDLIKTYIKQTNTQASNNVQNFLESALNYNSKTNSVKLIDEYIQYLDELRLDKKNIWKLLAFINKNEIIKVKSPFVWNVTANPYNSHEFISQISPFIFETLQVYGFLSESEYKQKFTKDKFNNYLKNLFSTTLKKEDAKEYTNVAGVLNEIIDAYFCKEDINTDNIIITSKEAAEKYNFNWTEFAKELGYKTIPTTFLCNNINYLKCGTKLLLEKWDSDEWRGFWIWIYIRGLARFTKDWSYIYFEYYGKTLRGQKEEGGIETKATALTCAVFNKLINKLYLNQYVDIIKLNFVEKIAEELRIVFKRIITRNEWMSKKTKKYALEKLDAVKFLLAQPPDFSEDPPNTIKYKNNELYSNLISYSTWRSNYLISLTGKRVQPYPIVSWSEYPIKFLSYQSYTVNAQYIPSINSIYIPAAYIQKPFIDLDNRTIAYNLANIGFTIAHELSHALDNTGSKYDKNGNRHDWWTDEDKQKYKKIQKNILKQYEEWAKRDGLKYNAKKTIDEDIADISGLAICNEFLRDYVTNITDNAILQIPFYKLFYIHFAINLRQKLLNEVSQLLENAHPPDVYRCNIPLSRSLLFRTIFNIKKGDKMWWHSTNQVW